MSFRISWIVGLTVSCLWFMVLVWRKPFSYVEILGVYVIDFFVLVLAASMFFLMLLQGHTRVIAFRGWKNLLQVFSLAGFTLVGVASLISSTNLNAKALIPLVYTLYFPFFLILFLNIPPRIRIRILNFQIACYLILPLLYYGLRLGIMRDFTNSLPAIDDAGWTFTYGLSLAVALFLSPNVYLRVALSLMALLAAVVVFQRGVFLCFILASVFYFFSGNAKAKFVSLINYSLVGVAGFFVVLMVADAAFSIAFPDREVRYSLDPATMFRFISSIFYVSGDLGGDAVGTRSHRFEMWLGVVDHVISDARRLIFGSGFSGEVGDVIGISFRVPHNGFVTILFRMGVLGLICYVIFLISIFLKCLKQRCGLAEKASVFCLLNLGAFLGDVLTGTIIDSPFTYFLWLVSTALCLSVISGTGTRSRHTSESNGGKGGANKADVDALSGY